MTCEMNYSAGLCRVGLLSAPGGGPGRISTGVLVLMLAVFVGCGGSSGAPEHWAYTNGDVVGPPAAPSESIQVDVYLDGTSSMIGYLAGGNSTYLRFLEELESSIGAGWAQADMDYFKFGTAVRRIDRGEFRNARDAAFYRERGIFETTSIDSVIERMDRSGVSIVITDLFQDEGDVNALVSKIKDEVFREGLQLAVLGVESEFNGTIYDARVPPYRYASTQGSENTYRPFYALMFGEAATLTRIFDVLNSNAYVRNDHFLLISPYVVEDYTVDLSKASGARYLSVGSASGAENRYAFILREGGTGGDLQAEVILDRAAMTPDLSADQVELVTYRKHLVPGSPAGQVDSTRVQDFSLGNVQNSGDTLRATLQLNLAEPAGRYAYMVVFQTGAISGLETPAWIEGFSSENPSPERDANKTLNLERFVSDLIQASSSVYQPRLAKTYITVRKL